MLNQLSDAYEKAMGDLRVVTQLIETLDQEDSTGSIQRVQESYNVWRGRDSNDNIMALEERLRENRMNVPTQVDVKALTEESIFDMLDNLPTESEGLEDDEPTLNHVPSYLPDALIPMYDQAVAWLVNMLVRLDMIKPSQARSSAWASAGLDAAEEKHRESKEEVDRIHEEIESLERSLRERTDKYGREDEFFAIQDKCVTKDMGAYTYELCFGGKASQISNNDGFRFNLGSFQRFDVDKKYNETDDRHYLSMLYANGQMCWNGPPRSSRITLECGDDDALLHVFEAEKCTYSMRAQTPAVCFPRATADDDESFNHEYFVHDEL